MSLFYSTPFPVGATSVICERLANQSPKRIEFHIRGKVVGEQVMDRQGRLISEWSLQAGIRSETRISYDENGRLCSTENYEDDLEHGQSRQWKRDGTLMGSYWMDKGTGWDLWRNEDFDGEVILSEARRYENGLRHGPEWWIGREQDRVSSEAFFSKGENHGIERRWDLDGHLREGYPRFWIDGVEVDIYAYVKQSSTDNTLRPYREVDDNHLRDFPPEIACHLNQKQ